MCQDGGAGDACSNDHDCAPVYGCGLSGSCGAGHRLGVACESDDECGTANCSNDYCAPDGFAYIPAGTFCMGSPDGSTECMGVTDPAELGRETNETLHQVTLTRAFFLQETEVTQRQWEAFRFTNPSSYHHNGLDCPVENTNWWEAVAYLNALSVSEGLEPCYRLEGCHPFQAGTDIDCSGITISDPNASGSPYLCEGYRLPTEAEWEYAYRAGTTTAFYNGDATETDCELDSNLDAIGWYCANSGSTTHVVSALNVVDPKAPNDWGLYDMSGNVWEWVWDRYDSYPSSLVEDPLGGTGPQRVRRGGAFSWYALTCRAALRHPGGPREPLTATSGYPGFRAARSAR